MQRKTETVSDEKEGDREKWGNKERTNRFKTLSLQAPKSSIITSRPLNNNTNNTTATTSDDDDDEDDCGDRAMVEDKTMI